jgi:DNA-binding response OmpR family regulator
VRLKQIFEISTRRRATLLLIEDDGEACERLASGLSLLGFRVFQAANGFDAETIYRSVPVDVVITNLMMPDKDGIEIMLGLQKELPNLPIIAMAEAKTPKVITTSASLLGAKAVLLKPCAAAELAAAVRNVMGTSGGTYSVRTMGEPREEPSTDMAETVAGVSLHFSKQERNVNTGGTDDGLHGPFRLNDRSIDSRVTRTSAGVYALDNPGISGTFRITCVGRSDDLNNQLHVHVGGYKYFKYVYCDSARAAFEKECSLYHRFEPQDNPSHPLRPGLIEWTCPLCKLFG